MDQDQIKLISTSLSETLKDSELYNLTIDIAEAISDNLLSEGTLKDIPIIGTIYGLGKTAFNIKDLLLIKKLLYFLNECKNINAQNRRNMISRIDNSGKEKIKIGEKLIYLLDKCEDHIVSQYIAILFSAFLNEKISYSEFLRCASIVQKIPLLDLEKFIETPNKDLETNIDKYEVPSDFQNALISVGICASSIEPISVQDNDDHNTSDRYDVIGGDLTIYLTEVGLILKKTLNKIIV